MAILLEFSMTPLGKGESVGQYVAPSLDIIDRSGLPYQLTAMGTLIEGKWDQVMGVVEQCLDHMSRECDRVTCSIKIDWRRGATGRIETKVARVEAELGRALHH